MLFNKFVNKPDLIRYWKRFQAPALRQNFNALSDAKLLDFLDDF